MRLAENVVQAVKRIRAHPMRSLLVLQGTIWGIGVALFGPAVMEGTGKAGLERAQQVGADRLTVAADPTAVEGKPLARDDVAEAKAAVEAKGVPVTVAAGMHVEKGGKVDGVPEVEAFPLVFGPPEAFLARGLELAAGRAPDPKAGSPEAVVEGILASEIAARRVRALGERIVLPDGTQATIVGVLEAREDRFRRQNDLGMDTGHAMFKSVVGRVLLSLGVPWTDDGWKRTDRCAYLLAQDDRVDWIYLRVPPMRLRDARDAVEERLMARGRIPLLFYAPAYPMLLSDQFQRFKSMSFALFLACLVMGGVVMANVGLLSALSRAPEVAIHRVEGARRRDVAVQFVTEAVVLAVVGVGLGFALACGLAELRCALEPTAGVAWAFPWPRALVAALVALVVGAGAGSLPAVRAARQDPVEALVDE